jgi:peptide/nickel transport system substrate-binding protein
MKKMRLRALVAASAAVVTLASCGGASSEGSASETLVTAIGTNPPHFNRWLTTEIGTMLVGQTIYESLVKLDAEYQVEPYLATAWSANESATQYTFELREDVLWSDGEAFTAEDVKFTFDNYIPLSPASSAYAHLIKSVTTPDEHTVVVDFSEPFAPFVEALAGAWILPEHIFGDGQDVATHSANSKPIGTGPYKLESFSSGDRAVVVANDEYWGGDVEVDQIVFKVMPDANARVLALESGDVDYVYGTYVDKAAYERLQADDHFAFMPGLGGVSTVTMHVNTQTEELADPEVRRALYQAIDREGIAEKAYYGYATPARGAIPAEMSWAVDPSIDFSKELPYDPPTAEEHLDSAGLAKSSDGKRFTVRLAYPSEYPTVAAAAGVIKSDLEAVGVGVDLIAEDFQVWTERTFSKNDYDLSLIFYTTFEDPSLGVTRSYICNPDKIPYRNASGLCDDTLDAAFAAAGRTTDREVRAEAFATAERRILELMHTYPIVVEPQFNIGRSDRWEMEEAHRTHPIDWALLESKS